MTQSTLRPGVPTRETLAHEPMMFLHQNFEAQADARLEADLVKYADEVSRAIGDARTTQHQFDALVSFHYNTGAIATATLTKKHKAGDYAGAAKEFARWNKSGGRVMAGLTRRRAAEAELYSS